jgi:hypothetical protein
MSQTPEEPNRKWAGELTMADFVAFPVWTWDDDGDIVVPVEFSMVLPDAHDALFVAAELQLASHARLSGAVSVRMSDQQVYLLSFFGPGRESFDFRLQPELRSLASRAALASHLDRPHNDVFPIIYETPFIFSNGQRLAGQID